MKRILTTLSIGVVACSLAMTSCGDDNEEPDAGAGSSAGVSSSVVNPATVFPYGVPRRVDDLVITTGSDGRVTQMQMVDDEDDLLVTFDYNPVKHETNSAARPSDYDMTIWEDDSAKDWYTAFFIRLNSMGYIEYVFGEFSDEGEVVDEIEWWFSYNEAGQLLEMKQIGNDWSEVRTLTYNSEGDIIRITHNYDLEDTATVSYTDATHTAPIINKSGIMFYDAGLIAIDEMYPVYYAGLLGKGTTHLPLVANYNYRGNYTKNYRYKWILDGNDMPVSFTMTVDSYTADPVVIRW